MTFKGPAQGDRPLRGALPFLCDSIRFHPAGGSSGFASGGRTRGTHELPGMPQVPLGSYITVISTPIFDNA